MDQFRNVLSSRGMSTNSVVEGSIVETARAVAADTTAAAVELGTTDLCFSIDNDVLRDRTIGPRCRTGRLLKTRWRKLRNRLFRDRKLNARPKRRASTRSGVGLVTPPVVARLVEWKQILEDGDGDVMVVEYTTPPPDDRICTILATDAEFCSS